MPHVKCTQNQLLFLRLNNDLPMTVTLSGLHFRESLLTFQDFSAMINGCIFEGGEQSTKFLVEQALTLNIEVTNSMFRNIRSGISVNAYVSLIKTRLLVKNTSFDVSASQDKGNCIDVTAYETDCILDSVTFTSQNALITSNPNQFWDPKNQSGFTVNSSIANISVKKSIFIGSNAGFEFLNLSTLRRLSLQIINSNFTSHTGEGYGPVMSLKGKQCQIDVSNSSFSNAMSILHGGAISIECPRIKLDFQENIFKDTRAIKGKGGALYISTNDPYPSSKFESDELYQLNSISISKCRFSNTSSYLGGGAFGLDSNSTHTLTVSIYDSAFNNCASSTSGGGAIALNSFSSVTLTLNVINSTFSKCKSAGCTEHGGSLDVSSGGQTQVFVKNSNFTGNTGNHARGGALNIEIKENGNGSVTVENSMFKNNIAHQGGAMFLQLNRKSTVKFQKVIMESNKATGPKGRGGAAIIFNNFKLEILESIFQNNQAGECSAICVNDTQSILVAYSFFDNNFRDVNHPYDEPGSGALSAMSKSNDSLSISILNTKFSNCLAAKGSAIFVKHSNGNASFVLNRSHFVNNSAIGGLDREKGYGYGGAVLLSLAPNSPFQCGCAKSFSNFCGKGGPYRECRRPLHEGRVLVEDTKFEKNRAEFGGAIHLVNGNVFFRKCNFTDNFSSTHGGHIHTNDGSTSLNIQGCLFRRNKKYFKFGQRKLTATSFIHTESARSLKIHNTTLDALLDSRPHATTFTLLAVYDGIDYNLNFGNSAFYCPNGSQLERLNFSSVIPMHNHNDCKTFNITTRRYDCKVCPIHTYSLQRGSVFEDNKTALQCHPCPFGADCTGNISAKPDFWGFKNHLDPPTLKFTMCPHGYCRPPKKTDFSEYNGCQGNRFGKLCGQCKVNYSESLYSATCRPSQECKDYWFWPLAFLYVSFMALYFTFRTMVLPWIKRQLLWFKDDLDDEMENSFDSGYLKIIFYFYQAADLLLISKSSKIIIKTHVIEPFMGFFNFQQRLSLGGSLCPFPGLTVLYKKLFSSCHVAGTFVMICAFYACHYCVQKLRGQKYPSPQPYLGGILRTMLLGYSTLGSTSFSLLRCVPIGSEKRLFYDGNIVCFQWWQYILIAFVFVSFVPFVVVLFWGSFKLYSGTISTGIFILACCFPLPLLLYWAFAAKFCKASNVYYRGSFTRETSRNSAERVLYDSFKRPEDGGKLSLSWESVMIGRRLVLIVFKVFINDPMPRLLFMTFFSVLFLLHHALTQPFRDSTANKVETISLLFLVVLAIVNVFFASFMSLAVPFSDHFSFWWDICQGVEIVILCFVPVLFGIFLAITILSQLCRMVVAVWFSFRPRLNSRDDITEPLISPIN